MSRIFHTVKDWLGVSSVLLFLTLALATCSARQGIELSTIAIRDFHGKYNNGQYQEIYLHSDESLKKKRSEAETISFFSKLREKLGDVGEAKLTNQSINVTTMGTIVSSVYDTEFSKGKGQEQYIYIIKDGAAKLMDYKVNSPLLLP